MSPPRASLPVCTDVSRVSCKRALAQLLICTESVLDFGVAFDVAGCSEAALAAGCAGVTWEIGLIIGASYFSLAAHGPINFSYVNSQPTVSSFPQRDAPRPESITSAHLGNVHLRNAHRRCGACPTKSRSPGAPRRPRSR